MHTLVQYLAYQDLDFRFRDDGLPTPPLWKWKLLIDNLDFRNGYDSLPPVPTPLKKATVDNLDRKFGYDAGSCSPTSFIHVSGFNNPILFSPSTKILKRGLHLKHSIKVMYVTVETLLLGLADLIRPWNKSCAPTDGNDIYFTYHALCLFP